MKITFQMHNSQWPAWEVIKSVSEWDITHISIRITDVNYDSIWEARFWKRIQPIPWWEYEYKNSIVRIIWFSIFEKSRIENIHLWLWKQMWKEYDITWVFSFIWFFIPVRNWKWFCSEFATVFLMKFIVEIDRYDQKQTPYWFENIALLTKKLLW